MLNLTPRVGSRKTRRTRRTSLAVFGGAASSLRKTSAIRSDKDRELRASLFPDEPAMPPACSIKAKLAKRAHVTGHVGIYHMQACRSYAPVTKPDRWFCSEEDAQAAGFRKAYNCRAITRRK